LIKNDISSLSFKTNLRNCFTCKQSLQSGKLHKHEALVYFASKLPQKCQNNYTECQKCSTKHFMSYYITKNEDRFFYKTCLESDFIAFTNQTIFEMKLLRMVSSDIFYKHASFKGFCSSYNYNFMNEYTKRHNLIHHRLTDSWFFYKLLVSIQEYLDIK
jgi:hypothetical protein